ncbi:MULTISPECIES: DUF805 domain-containing protein [unclassified Microbacterium]|uniref:DUF805 domain-containing protein n=1 Tax=unclassified Microbacterium TaxID=2609290 RepID=UPI001DB8D76D|nr:MULTISPECIES: DUF805 domain-containing protein [unclassified Microbacterium]MBT9605892.1 DUF805 domain-containing protein [Microbacterium sp.]CAH0169814.1 Inner membrane protein YhaI [Microbacterium sp. Bi128]
MTNPQAVPALNLPYYGAPIGAAVQRFFKKYATFTGRASRSEYWWWALVMFLVGIVLVVLALATGGPTVDEMGRTVGPSGLGLVFYVIYGLWSLATIVPHLALTVRRLHDTNRSGFWIFIAFVPFVGGIILFVFMLLEQNPQGARFDA